jgi:hypothetical protein
MTTRSAAILIALAAIAPVAHAQVAIVSSARTVTGSASTQTCTVPACAAPCASDTDTDTGPAAPTTGLYDASATAIADSGLDFSSGSAFHRSYATGNRLAFDAFADVFASDDRAFCSTGSAQAASIYETTFDVIVPTELVIAGEAAVLAGNRGGTSQFTVRRDGGAIISGYAATLPDPANFERRILLGPGRYVLRAEASSSSTRAVGGSAEIVFDVRIPCFADFDRDGAVDFFDFDAFTLAFETALPTADVNRDGFLDFFDANDFVTLFELGC